MSSIERLLAIMARLRDPDGGCPWDLEQDFASIAPYTIEEAYEVDDAIRRRDFRALREELGDLLLQVVYHARMAGEAGHFDFADVVASICDKLVRRHPHVFGDAEVESAAAQIHAWEEHKAAERAARGGEGAMDGVPLGLPALLRAAKLQRRAARSGFAWRDARAALDKVAEEMDELREELRGGGPRERLEQELGDLLFAVATLGTQLELDPEGALRAANARFERRFRAMETRLARRSSSAPPSPEDWLAAWRQVREQEES